MVARHSGLNDRREQAFWRLASEGRRWHDVHDPLTRLAALLCLLIVTLGLGCGGQAAPRPVASAPSQPGSTEIGDLIPHSARKAETTVARPPARLRIPAIGVDAAVEHVPFLAVPQDPGNVAWFRTGPAPGEGGDAVFDGHLDWTTGPAVFWHLRDLRVGDAVMVRGAATPELTFVVSEVDVVDAASTPPAWLYAHDGPPELSLITCEGYYSRAGGGYNQRLLVRSRLQVS